MRKSSITTPRCGGLFVLGLALVLGVSVARASITGSISGTVTDPTGAVVPDASVVAINTQTDVQNSTKTNAQGFYSFPSLPAGRYDVTITASGFQEFRETGFVLDVNNALRVDATLKVGTATQQVEVTAAAVQVETSNTQMGQVIGGNKMTSLPLNGRSYTDLLALQPGVAPATSGEGGGNLVSGDLNPGNFSISGQREAANGFMVNGGSAEEKLYMAAAVIPNLDSIAEFRILTNNADAEYGFYSGGMINVLTKSGTNQFHGSAFEFLRNPNLDARNFYSPTRATLHQNQFGGTGGGPIRRDKLFFFADYQGTRLVQGIDTGLIAVPSAADRTGNLSDESSLLTQTNAQGQPIYTVSGTGWASTLQQELGYPVTAGEPYYTPGCTSNSKCVFPNAIIPQSAFTVPTQQLLKYIPLPNAGAYYTTSAYEGTLSDNKGSGRLDANTSLGMISGYFFIDNYVQLNPYGVSNLPGFEVSNNGQATMFNLGITKSHGPSSVNELRFNYVRNVAFQNAPDGGLGVSLASQGFTGIVPEAPNFQGVQTVSFNNYSIGASSSFLQLYDNTYQVLDNFSKVIGTHTVKIGGAFSYDQVTYKFHFALNGNFGFNGSETGFDFADFLIGAPIYYQQGLQLPLYSRGRSWAVYGQDSWRVKQNLTLNYGLRWEVSTPWWEAHNQIESLLYGCQSVVFPGAPPGWCFPGDPGVPSTLAPTRYNNFAPRIGLAYSPSAQGGFLGKVLGGPGKSSIRAAWGMYYSSFENRALTQETGDAPYGFFWYSPAPPQFATPFVNRGSGITNGQRFPVPVPPLNVSPTNPDNSVNWAQFEPITSSPAFFHTNNLPYAEHYNFTFERQFGTATVLSLSYVGTQGHRLLATMEANTGNPALCLSVSQPNQVLPAGVMGSGGVIGNGATCGPGGENGTYYPVTGGVITTTRYPYNAAFGSNGYMATMANSNYNAFEATLRRTQGRLEFLLGYTWSKSLDNASGNGLGQGDNINPLNPAITKALSAFNVPQNFVISYSYRIPFDKLGGPRRLTDGWTINGITRFATGFPVYLQENDDNSLLGTFSTGQGNNIDEPNRLPGSLKITDPRKAVLPSPAYPNGLNPYFNTALFTKEAIGQLGNASRRFFNGPGWNNWDIALEKNLQVTESKSFQFRAELFNAWNHAQFCTACPSANTAGTGLSSTGNILSSTFGFITNAWPARIGQVGIKFLF
jgi:hypothetical protein